MEAEKTEKVSAGEGPHGFFAKKVRNFVSKEFFKDLKSIEKVVREMPTKDVLERYASLSTKAMKLEPAGPGLYLYVAEDMYEAARKGYVAPSMFVKYRMCARGLAIELMSVAKRGGALVHAENLRSFLRGLLVHRLYYEKYACGEVEYRVESPKYGIVGYVDELRKEFGTYTVIEVKSSHRPDIVGASLQVMSYMLALSDQESTPLDNIYGYVVTASGTYRVYFDEEAYREYLLRLKKVVEVALNNDVNNLPPRLSASLSRRCGKCPYRGECLTLPDNYRTYGRYFEAMGFTKLHTPKTTTTLTNYSRK